MEPGSGRRPRGIWDPTPRTGRPRCRRSRRTQLQKKKKKKEKKRNKCQYLNFRYNRGSGQLIKLFVKEAFSFSVREPLCFANSPIYLNRFASTSPTVILLQRTQQMTARRRESVGGVG